MRTDQKLRSITMSGFVALFLFAVKSAGAEPPAEASDFLRFVENGRGGKLEVAVVSYLDAEGHFVDLVGAVHLADASYYKDLNERFEQYDAVLFELVGRPEILTDNGSEGGTNAIRLLQTSMTRFLELEFQLDAIDYRAKNFVHADLTMEEFSRLQEERGETIFTLVENMMRVQMASEDFVSSQPGLIDIISAFVSGNRAGAFKRLLAKQIAEMETLVIAAERQGSTVLFTERNKRVMETLQKQMEKDARRLAIFFGAGHHVDLEQRLLELGFHKVGESWLTAWVIRE